MLHMPQEPVGQRSQGQSQGSGLGSCQPPSLKITPMARPLRIEFADAVYHVTSRGDRRESLYRDDENRQRHFKAILVDRDA